MQKSSSNLIDKQDWRQEEIKDWSKYLFFFFVVLVLFIILIIFKFAEVILEYDLVLT